MRNYIPHQWTSHEDDYGKPYGKYHLVTNLVIQRATVVHTAAGNIQIETDFNDRQMYMLDQIPTDQREGLSINSIVLIDNDAIHNRTRAFDGLHPYPIAYEPVTILGHKMSDKRIRFQHLYTPSLGGDHIVSLLHVVSPLVEYRRNDYHPKAGEEVQYIGGFREDNTYKNPVFGHVLQVQYVGNGAQREEQYLVHFITGETTVHTRSELRSVKNVVYVHMKGAWD